jgi:hypothetical protein
MHPQRELNDSIIYDAEYTQDIFKRLDEQRHHIAIMCVGLGVYKDVYEAKQGIRGIITIFGLYTFILIDQMIKDSDYKFKHLLYR